MKQEYIEILLEEMNGKFDLVLEGHQVLSNEINQLRKETNEHFDLVDLKFIAVNTKIDKVSADLNSKIDKVSADLNSKIDKVSADLNAKIDDVATDLKAHRQDTEAHHGVYRVKES